jgi:hypothetical protein
MLVFVQKLVKQSLKACIPSVAKPYASRLYKNFRYHCHTCIGCYPIIFFGIHSILGDYGWRLTGRETDLVIEGAPRVASTYCMHAFISCQDHQVSVATNTHAAANVLRAEEFAIPSLVLIREPEAAIRSGILRFPGVSQFALAARYYYFYRTLEKKHASFVIADFADVINDVGAVIRRVNDYYGTRFKSYVDDIDDEDHVYASLLTRDRATRLSNAQSYLPNTEKEKYKRSLVVHKNTRIFRKCKTIYWRMSPLFR